MKFQKFSRDADLMILNSVYANFVYNDGNFNTRWILDEILLFESSPSIQLYEFFCIRNISIYFVIKIFL